MRVYPKEHQRHEPPQVPALFFWVEPFEQGDVDACQQQREHLRAYAEQGRRSCRREKDGYGSRVWSALAPKVSEPKGDDDEKGENNHQADETTQPVNSLNDHFGKPFVRDPLA